MRSGKFRAQQRGRGQCLLRGNVTGGGHHDVGLAPFVIAGPIPDANAFGAMDDGFLQIQILQVLLLVAHDHVHVVLAAQAMIGNRKQAVHVRRKINAGHVGAFVDHDIEKAGILMRKAVVVLPPYGGSDQQIQRRDGLPPGKCAAHFQPLGMLVEHGVDDVDKRFVGSEEPMPPGEQVAFQHSLHGVLAQHFKDTTVVREVAAVVVFREKFLDPEFLAHGVDRVEPVRGGFVGPEDAEVLHVLFHHIAQQSAERTRILSLR